MTLTDYSVTLTFQAKFGLHLRLLRSRQARKQIVVHVRRHYVPLGGGGGKVRDCGGLLEEEGVGVALAVEGFGGEGSEGEGDHEAGLSGHFLQGEKPNHQRQVIVVQIAKLEV